MFKFEKIQNQYKENLSFSEIARELKIERRTVAKYVKSNTQPKYSKRKDSGRVSPMAKYTSALKEKLEQLPNWSGEEAYEWLKINGYTGSLRTVERSLQKIRVERPKERFFEQKYEPGVQCQFDFKEELVLPFVTGELKVQLHFGTLPYSSAFSIKAYPQKNYECFIDGIHSFFESIGGMPLSVRIDNLSPCVKKILSKGQRVYTEKFDAAIKYYGFECLPCSPGKGNEKGDVERDIRTHSRWFLNYINLNGIKFKDFDHLNEVLSNYTSISMQSEKFKEEVEKLKPLSARDEDVLCRIDELSTTKFGMIKFCGTYYSVPDEAIGVRCRVVGSPYEVKIIRIDTRKVVAQHRRADESKGQILLEHVITSLERKPRAMIGWSHKEALFPTPTIKEYYDHLKKNSSTPERDFLRVLNLIQYVSIEEISIALDLAMKTQSHQSFDDIKSLVMNEKKTKPIDIHFQEPIITSLKVYDQLIPIGI